MPEELAIRLKVFRNSGRISDVIDSDHGGLSDNAEEIEQLIIRKNMKNRWAQGLRIVFFSLILAAVIFIFSFIARSHIIHPSSFTVNVLANCGHSFAILFRYSHIFKCKLF